ncbi:MAG: YraN family protein [Elusimicrobia bacterium GWA2_61_42]|nr:MAG: YraN family protein [Elusimicrobia bacterium GWA2_61_42]OGR75136.1 MAG: YraN family protein [Elusimicrobia bacterium GWC2_61_25]
MNEKGARYEEQAALFLKAAGFEILDRNWSTPMGELDIVARKGDTVVFVEVRARSNPGYGTPAESVTPAKRARLIRTAQAYLKARRPAAESFRFDVIGIVPGAEPEHIEDAFSADGFGF